MKRLAWLTGIILAVVALLFGINVALQKSAESGLKTGSNKTLTIYNWGDYVDPSLIKKFQKETGYKVDYETFD